MSSITVSLPDEDLDFLRAYTKAQGTSAEAFLAQQARQLRIRLQEPLHPDLVAATGVIAGDLEARDAYRAHLDAKHQ